MQFDDDTVVIVLPPGITPVAGDRVCLSQLNTDTPLLEIGLRKLVGQHQRLIGTTAIFSKPSTLSSSTSESGASGVSSSSLAESAGINYGSGGGGSDGGLEGLIGGRRIVFKLVNRSLQDQDNRDDKGLLADIPQSTQIQSGRGRGRGRGRIQR